MNVIVCKFGGTSTAGPEQFKQIRAILEADGARRYAVLSAPGAAEGGRKVTDLLSACRHAALNGRDLAGPLDEIVRRFRLISEGLALCDMDDLVRREVCRGAYISDAHALSRGEYLCARLFSAYSGLPMVDACELVRFDDTGTLDEATTLSAFRAMAVRYERAVIPGFYGSGQDGRIVTFPRNGSDITGALAAAGIGAYLYENWTDVPGLMTADPALDPHAEVISEISCGDMRRLSESGAQVLHPDCLKYVERTGIPVRIRCTACPALAGTLIEPK